MECTTCRLGLQRQTVPGCTRLLTRKKKAGERKGEVEGTPRVGTSRERKGKGPKGRSLKSQENGEDISCKIKVRGNR